MSPWSAFKGLARAVLPGVAADAYRSRQSIAGGESAYRGEYPDWKSAEAASTGYASDEIVKRVMAAALKVKNGEAVYERDSVLFDERQYSWPVAAALLWSAQCNEGVLDVIDFGGSLGSSYFQNRPFLDGMKEVRWNIVEQPKFVEVGRAKFQDKTLRFHTSIASCGGSARLVLFSSTLQYLQNPFEVLGEVVRSGAEMIVIDRTVFVGGPEDRVTVHTVPAEIYGCSLPMWLFSESKLAGFLAPSFGVFSRFPSYLSTASLDRESRAVEELGFIFVRWDSPLAHSLDKP